MIVTVFSDDSILTTIEVPNEIPELLGDQYGSRVANLLTQWSARYKEECKRFNAAMPYDKMVFDPDRTPGHCFARYLGMNRIPAREVERMSFYVRVPQGIWEPEEETNEGQNVGTDEVHGR